MSAGGQMDNRQVVKLVASGLCPRRSLNFKTTVAHKGRRYKNFRQFQTSVHWRARFLPSRDFGSSAGRQVGSSANWQVGMSAGGQMDNRQVVKLVASGLCPRRQLNFKTTVAHKGRRYKNFGNFKLLFTGGRGSCRAVISAGRQFGKSASRQVGKSAGGQFGGLTVGSVGALSPTVVKLQNNRHPQGATLQKFSAISNFCSLEGEAPAEP